MDNSQRDKLPKGFDEKAIKAALKRVENYDRIEDVARDMGIHKKTLSATIRTYTGVNYIRELHTKPRTVDPRYISAAEMVNSGLTLQQVAENYHVSKQAVSIWLRKAGIDKSPRAGNLAKSERRKILLT